MSILGILIGKGTFSKVYDNGDDTVTIVSDCYVKECLSFGWINSDLFPECERLENINDTSAYRMKKYDKVGAIKKNISSHQWKLYQWLRDNLMSVHAFNPNDNHHKLCDMLQTMPEAFEEEKEELISAIDGLANYGTDMSFEISPRNVAIDNGKLVLLDCFFFVSQLRVKNNERTNRSRVF